MKAHLIFLSTAVLLFSFCNGKRSNENQLTPTTVANDKEQSLVSGFADYWYNGKAEITSYKLSQARYGEIHEGHAVLIYVTEQFLPKRQLKADRANDTNIPVLKLNSTRKFLTGIYPYSLMNSVFSPINGGHALKNTFSAQEWCGHTYVQLNNREKYNIEFHSYFESKGDEQFELSKEYLENELWTIFRLSPDRLPTGKLKMIPSLEYLALHHKEIRAYDVEVELKQVNGVNFLSVHYPELERTLTIKFSVAFPHSIEGWEENYVSGFGNSKMKLTTKAEKIKSIRSDYWNKNNASDRSYRKELGL